MKNKHGWKPLPALYLTDDTVWKQGLDIQCPGWINVGVCVECVCVYAYLKRLQFDDENKPWHISMENFQALHANLEQGRAPVCMHVFVRAFCVCCCGWSRQLFRFSLTVLSLQQHQFKHDSQGQKPSVTRLFTTSFCLFSPFPYFSFFSIFF